MSLLEQRYNYLFQNLEEEMKVIYETDKVINSTKDTAELNNQIAQEFDAKAEATRKEVQNIESEIAAVEGKLKELHAARASALGLVKTYIYQANNRRRRIKHNEEQITRRMKFLTKREAARRLREAQKDFQ